MPHSELTTTRPGILQGTLWLGVAYGILYCYQSLSPPDLSAPTPIVASSLLRDVTRALPLQEVDFSFTSLSPNPNPDWMEWIAEAKKPLPSPCPVVDTTVLRAKETLLKALSRVGVNTQEARQAAKALCGKGSIAPGQRITCTLERVGTATRLKKLLFSPSFGHEITLTRRADGSYLCKKANLPIIRSIRRVRGNVKTQFSSDIVRAGLPKNLVKEVLSAFGSLVNFKRHLHPGDSFEFIYERLSTKNSDAQKIGKLLCASLALGGTRVAVYRFPGASGDRFYTANGESVSQGGMCQPIAGARRTSGFGRRKHPLFGYSHRHKGIDLAAPYGTPVAAAAAGVVNGLSFDRGYGRCITLKHAGGYGTFYAHLSRFNRNVRPGMPVRRGQVIGFVGSSGWSTGAHLHYEVRLHGKQVNPASVRSATQCLSGRDLRKFQKFCRSLGAVTQRIPA